MSERANLINILKKRNNELNSLQNRQFTSNMGQFDSLRLGISQDMMQTIIAMGVFLLIGLFIGFALNKRK